MGQAHLWSLVLLILLPGCISEQRKYPKGIIDVTQSPYNADPTGSTDSTAALQKAIIDAAKERSTVFIPAGRFMVTDTLNCTISWPFMTPQLTDPGPPTPDFLFAASVIVGEQVRPGYPDDRTRPTTLFVPPSTPGFTSKTHSKYVVHFWHTGATPAQFSQPDININQIFQGIDIDIGSGNFGAVGIMNLGAQGSSIEDVTVWAGDAAIGLNGAAGGGGSHANVRVVGGRYGLNFLTAQPAPTLTAATLINQSCSALIYQGRGPLTIVGGIFEQLTNLSADSVGIVAAGIPVSKFKGDCALPTPPQDVWDHSTTFGGSISMIDSTIESGTISASRTTAIVGNRSLFLQNVYIKGISVVSAVGDVTLNVQTTDSWSLIDEYATSQTPEPTFYNKNNVTYHYTASIYSNGLKSSSNVWIPQNIKHVESIPSDLQAKHIWTEQSFQSFRSPGAVDASVDCGAVGDGETDNYGPLQRCVDMHDIVIVPKGFFRFSQTLVLSRPGGALVGVGRTSSVLMASHKNFNGTALIRVIGEGTTIFQIEYISFWHIPKVFLLDWQASNGIWRQSHGYRTCDFLAMNPQPNIGPSCAGFPDHGDSVALLQPLSVVSGGGKFYTFYIEDWHYQGPDYRHLLVNDSSGASFYHINNDCAFSDAAVEVRHSTNVNLFGMKAEGNFCQLWIRNSSEVAFTGFGGFGSPFTFDEGYPDGYQQYIPSTVRVERSSNITLANLWGDLRVGPVSPSGFGGHGTDPRNWTFVVWQSTDGPKSKNENFLPPMERPVVFKLP